MKNYRPCELSQEVKQNSVHFYYQELCIIKLYKNISKQYE
jgi:hypothetical protein